ncbi:hypothetical protein D3C83_315700 [compost metagenome]
MLSAGAVRVAADPGDLVRAVHAYLACPERDAAGRRAVAAQLCGRVDGHAAARVATAILQMLTPKHRRA